MKKILFILFISIAHASVAQSIVPGQDNIAFHSTEAINNGNTLNISNDFVIKGSGEIEWTQPATDKTTYTIANTTGSWEDLNAQGEIEFSASLSGIAGKIHLYRNNSGILKLRIDMFRNSVNLVPFEFVISSFEKLN